MIEDKEVDVPLWLLILLAFLLIVVILIVAEGCSAKKRTAPQINGFSVVAPRGCMDGEPQWSEDSYCRQVAEKWTCYKIKVKIKSNCEQLEVLSHP